jgi:hypothetical protein
MTHRQIAERPRAPSIIVRAVVWLDGHRQFINAGTAALTVDWSGRHLLCLRIKAMPADRRLYLPLQDVLRIAAQPPAEADGSDPTEAVIGHA